MAVGVPTYGSCLHGATRSRERGKINSGRDPLPHSGLLRLDGLVGVYDREFELPSHGEILFEQPPLEMRKLS